MFLTSFLLFIKSRHISCIHSTLGFAHMSSTTAAHIEDGQFEDAPDDATLPSLPTADPRNGYSYIDEDPIDLAESPGSDDSDLEDEERDAFEDEEDALEASAYNTLRAEDEDWEIAERGRYVLSHVWYTSVNRSPLYVKSPYARLILLRINENDSCRNTLHGYRTAYGDVQMFYYCCSRSYMVHV